MSNLQVVTEHKTGMKTRTSGADTVINLKLDAFLRSQRDIKEFVADNDRIMDTFFDLIEEYNTTLENIKTEIRKIPGDNKVSVGPFTRQAKPTSVKFNPDLLTESVLRLPGVVKIDRKEIEKAISEGKVTFSDVQDARSEEKGTARLNGPKEIQFSL